MAVRDDLIRSVDAVIAAKWTITRGDRVPESPDVSFLGNAIKLDATFFYADLADSTSLARQLPEIAAQVFQCFLSTASRLINHEAGEIRSFDGDRVMAVFIGPSKDATAARCALKINWAFIHIVKPKLLAAYGTKLVKYNLSYGSGIDAGQIWAVRAGVRNDSDLVWVGRAPNLAAKLSAIRDTGYPSYITKTVYDRLGDARFGGNPRRDMWEARSWKEQDMAIYRSGWSWPP